MHEKAGVVSYQPKIVDGSGITETWSFEHQVAPDVLQKASSNVHAATDLAQKLAAMHTEELLAARSWRCCVCCKEEAVQLLQHPVPYMKLLQVGAVTGCYHCIYEWSRVLQAHVACQANGAAYCTTSLCK